MKVRAQINPDFWREIFGTQDWSLAHGRKSGISAEAQPFSIEIQKTRTSQENHISIWFSWCFVRRKDCDTINNTQRWSYPLVNIQFSFLTALCSKYFVKSIFFGSVLWWFVFHSFRSKVANMTSKWEYTHFDSHERNMLLDLVCEGAVLLPIYRNVVLVLLAFQYWQMFLNIWLLFSIFIYFSCSVILLSPWFWQQWGVLSADAGNINIYWKEITNRRLVFFIWII